jgi:hypothetical protein
VNVAVSDRLMATPTVAEVGLADVVIVGEALITVTFSAGSLQALPLPRAGARRVAL